MKITKTNFLLIMLVVVAIFTYFSMPKKFEIEGGSCYQGITSMFIKLILEICTILNCVAIILLKKSKINSSKTLSVISLILWCLISFFNSVDETSEDLLIGLVYFSPFLICNSIIIKAINNSKKALKENIESIF